MKRFWQFLALLLLALMVPASACCMGPKSMEHEDCGCCSKPDQDHDAQPEICPSDTIAHSQMPAPVILPDLQMVELAEVIRAWAILHDLSAQVSAPIPLMTTAPPELRTTWVFTSRAALPARAPSGLA